MLNDSIEAVMWCSTASVALILSLAKITVLEPATELKVSGEERVSDAAVRLE